MTIFFPEQLVTVDGVSTASDWAANRLGLRWDVRYCRLRFCGTRDERRKDSMDQCSLSKRRHYLIGVTKLCLLLALASPAAFTQTAVSFKPAPGSPVAVGASPSSVVLGDFNNDGKPDYAVANSTANTVSVFLGNGDGSFAPAPHSPFIVNRNPFPTPCLITRCSSVPIALAVGDLNGDGRQDLAVTNIPINDLCSISSVFGGMCSSVAVLLGRGDGSFRDSNQFDPGGQLPTSVAIGDFDRDGKQDLAVTNLNSATVSILLGDGTGLSFRQSSRSPVRVGVRPAWVAAGRFNTDSALDLAVANADDGTVSVLLGNGNGTFTPAAGSPIAVGTRPVSIAVADFNGDGNFDLAIADLTDSTVSVALGNGDGTFGTPARFGVGGQPSSVAVGDFNGDGNLDLAVANRMSNSVSLLRGNGDGSFVLTRNQPAGADPQSVAAGDFNGDNEMDLVVAITGSGTAAIFLNATDVVAPTTIATASPAPNSNGWNKSSVSVSLAATDNPGGSGVKEIRYTVGSNPETVVSGASAVINLTTQGSFPISYHAVDLVGNAESAHSLTVQIDAAAPTISPSVAPAANGAGWNNSNVTVSFTCADSLSGVASCTAPITVSAEGANQTAKGTAIDLAGNSATTMRAINLDKTAPLLTMPALASSYPLNASLPLNFSASDSLSGLASMTATLNGNPVTNGSTISLGQPGTNTFTLTATDVAGNTATQTATFSVLYNFNGFLPPISNDGSSVFKLGSTVPVKFQLTGAGGVGVSTAVAHLKVQLFANGIPVGDPIDATAPGSADIGDLFRYDGTQYIYNLSTKPLTAGVWQIQALLDDGTVHTVTIGTK